jgi:hypothetical protein
VGVTLHSKKGTAPAVPQLCTAAQHATWALQARCKAMGIVDFALRRRLSRALAEPILTYASEVWGPGQMARLVRAMASPLQVVQNTSIRQLVGLRTRTPRHTLHAKACLSRLPLAWPAAALRFWNRMPVRSAEGTLLRAAFLSDLHLTFRHCACCSA